MDFRQRCQIGSGKGNFFRLHFHLTANVPENSQKSNVANEWIQQGKLLQFVVTIPVQFFQLKIG